MSRWEHEYRSLDPNTRESVNDLVNAIFRAKTGFGGRIEYRSGSWDYPLDQDAYRNFCNAESLYRA